MNYETLENAIARWGAAQRDVQAVVVIGSRARTDHPADGWSDLDLILYVTDPQTYVDDSSWLDAFGQVWLRVLNFTGAGDPEWMVLYAGGFKVDFILTPITGRLDDVLSDSFYTVATRRGVRILLDKEEDGSVVPAITTVDRVWVQPTSDEFAALFHQFWLSIYRASNMVIRGELWRARTISDGQVRQQLLGMLEWHAKAKRGSAYDIWYQGRFLTDWVDAQELARLPEIFAPFNSGDTRRAIMAAMSLMNRLGRQTAEIWGYPYPIPNQTQIQDWIKATLSVE